MPLRAQTAKSVDAAAETPEEKFRALLHDAQTLQKRKRFLDSLTKLDEAEKLDPKHAEIYNIRGAVYLSAQMRDFDKAREQFKKSLELEPEAMPARFNLVETDYVQGRYADAGKGFAAILEKYPKVPSGVRHMVMFKQVVCLLKQGKVAEAEQIAQTHFTFMDDTPAYYFSKAVLALQKGDEKTGNEWLAKAQVIFTKTQTNAYLDTLMEGHYLDPLAIGPLSEDKENKGK
jgi:tetratricopeptide (TPR) repeat protein